MAISLGKLVNVLLVDVAVSVVALVVALESTVGVDLQATKNTHANNEKTLKFMFNALQLNEMLLG